MTKKQLVAFLMAAALVVTGGGVSTLASQVAADAKDAPKQVTQQRRVVSPEVTPPEATPEQEEPNLVISPSKLELKAGGSVTLKAYWEPDLDEATEVTWTTSDPKVATIDEKSGLVTAVADGTATITASAKTPNPISPDQSIEDTATATVTVSGASVETQSITIDDFSLAVGKSQKVKVTFNPADATDTDVVWSIDNEEVATITTDGVVTAKAVGTAKITATVTTTTGKTVTDDATVTVVASDTITSISLDPATLIVGKDKTAKITATLDPAGTDAVIEWTSSKPKVASVDSEGNVTGLKGGKAMITATVKDTDVSASCEVTVAAVTLNAAEAPLQVGKSTNAVKIAKQTLESDTVDSWTSSDSSIATVGPKGKIKGVAVGTATITVEMKSGATASCDIKVQKGKVKTKGLTLAPKGVTLAVKDKTTVTATRNPVTATDSIKWSTSNSKVAKVKNGKITATGVGTAKITATANGKKASIKVTVKKPSIKLAKTKATIKVGKSTTIKVAKVFPDTDKDKITYKSANTKIATVNKAGKVTGKKAGTTKITVTTESGAKATFTVTVKKKK